MADFSAVRQHTGTQSPVRHAGFFRCLLSYRHPKSGKSFGFIMVSAHLPQDSYGSSSLTQMGAIVNDDVVRAYCIVTILAMKSQKPSQKPLAIPIVILYTVSEAKRFASG